MYIYDYFTNNTEFKINQILGIEKEKIINIFTGKFIDANLLKESILFWNSLKDEYRINIKRMKINQINNLSLPNEKSIYIYLEREKKLFKGDVKSINSYYEHQEPWEETDITIFDESLNWVVAFTHEDEILTYGLKI